MTHDIEHNAPALSPTRRTVLTGAAWTLPVIAAATITPMAAASDAPVLAFDKSTYNGTACGTITGAYVTVTVNNVATAGKSVTTSLSGGYKFSDGTTTNTQVSGSDGRVNLPAVAVPSIGRAAPLTAICDGSTTTATTAAPAKGVAKNWFSGSDNTWTESFANVPATATPQRGLRFFRDGTDVWFKNAKLLSGVASAYCGSNEVHDYVAYVKDGKAAAWFTGSDNTWSEQFASVPGTATAIGGTRFFLNGSDIWYGNRVIVSGFTSAVAGTSNYHDWVCYVKDGVARAWFTGTDNTWSETFGSVPSAATAMGASRFFTDGTSIWYGNTLVTSSYTSAYCDGGDKHDWVSYLQNNVAKAWFTGSENTWRETFASVPSSAKPSGGARFFFTENGEIWRGNTKIFSDVSLATTASTQRHDFVSFIQSNC